MGRGEEIRDILEKGETYTDEHDVLDILRHVDANRLYVDLKRRRVITKFREALELRKGKQV